MSKKENKKDGIDKIIENTFDHLKDIVDANAVVGNIIDIGNKMYLIPVSRVSVGLISGGGIMPKGKNNINAGSGTGFNIEPIGFITVTNLNFGYLPVNTASDIGKTFVDTIMKVYDKFIENQKVVENEEE